MIIRSEVRGQRAEVQNRLQKSEGGLQKVRLDKLVFPFREMNQFDQQVSSTYRTALRVL